MNEDLLFGYLSINERSNYNDDQVISNITLSFDHESGKATSAINNPDPENNDQVKVLSVLNGSSIINSENSINIQVLSESESQNDDKLINIGNKEISELNNKDVSFGGEDSMIQKQQIKLKNQSDNIKEQMINSQIQVSLNHQINHHQRQSKSQINIKNRKNVDKFEKPDYKIACQGLINNIQRKINQENQSKVPYEQDKFSLEESSIHPGNLTDRITNSTRSSKGFPSSKFIRSSREQNLMISERDLSFTLQEDCIRVTSNNARQQRLNVYDKLYKDYQQQKKKKQNLVNLRVDENLAHCTFKPQILTNLRNGSQSARRTKEEFFSDMIRFKEIKETKVQQKRKLKQEKELMEFRKSTSKLISGQQSPMMAENADEIYDRLFKQGIKNVKYPNIERGNEFSNERLSKRSLMRTDHQEITKKLYEDAYQRQKKQQQKLRNSQERFNSNDKQVVIKTSAKSNQVLVGRLLKQIQKAFEEFKIIEVEKIEYQMFADILHFLGYIGDDIWNQERILKDAWKIVSLNESKSISKKSFIILINAINNIYLPWMNEQDEFANDFIIKSEQEAAQIHYKFFSFWEHSQKMKLSKLPSELSHLNNKDISKSRSPLRSKKHGLSPQQSNFTFKPSINERSSLIATQQISYLQNELEKMNIPFNHGDYLIKQGIQYKRKIEEEKEKSMSREIKKCTFKPKTNKNVNVHRDKSVFEELYLRSSITTRKNKDQKEIEFEKQRDQCTFRPNINKSVKPLTKNKVAKSKKKRDASLTPTQKDQTDDPLRSSIHDQIKENNPFRKDDQNRKDRSVSQIQMKGTNTEKDNKENESTTPTKINPYKRIKENQFQRQSNQPSTSIGKERQQNICTSGFNENQMMTMRQSMQSNQSRQPLLYLDVNIGKENTMRLVVYQGDNPEQVAKQFAQDYCLDEIKQAKLQHAIDKQLANLAQQLVSSINFGSRSAI